MRAPFATGLVAAALVAATSVPSAALAAPNATPTPGGPPPATAPAATQPSSGPPSGQQNRQDRMFLADATQDAQFQIAAGQLATNRAASAAVRSFGQRMVTDHRKELQRLQSLDRSVGITPPSAPRPNQQSLLKIWSSVRGGPFDCSYGPTMYALHELDVAMFALAARHAGNTQVRQFAAGELPMLRQHLQQAGKNLNNLNCSASPPAAAPS